MSEIRTKCWMNGKPLREPLTAMKVLTVIIVLSFFAAIIDFAHALIASLFMRLGLNFTLLEGSAHGLSGEVFPEISLQAVNLFGEDGAGGARGGAFVPRTARHSQGVAQAGDLGGFRAWGCFVFVQSCFGIREHCADDQPAGEEEQGRQNKPSLAETLAVVAPSVENDTIPLPINAVRQKQV